MYTFHLHGMRSNLGALDTNLSPLRIIALMITPVLTFSLGSIPSRLFRISTMPISSTNSATIPKWSIVSTMISELMMISFPAGLDMALF
jgi:hypothetical protein